MKSVMYSFLGAVVGALMCNALFWAIGQAAILLDVRLYKSEDEASRNFLVFLFIFAVSVVGGAVAGYRLSKRNRQGSGLQQTRAKQ